MTVAQCVNKCCYNGEIQWAVFSLEGSREEACNRERQREGERGRERWREREREGEGERERGRG